MSTVVSHRYFDIYVTIPPPILITNGANICWLNALLQVLIRAPAFVDVFDTESNTSTNPIIVALRNCIAGSFTTVPVDNHALARAIAAASGGAMAYNSFAAEGEALTIIMDTLDREIPNTYELFKLSTREHRMCVNCRAKTTPPGGRASTTYYLSVNNDGSGVVTVPSLQEVGILSFVICSLCGATTDQHYITIMHELPDILIIENRWNVANNMAADKTFPEELYFPTHGGTQLKYIKMGVVYYDGGHFTSQVKIQGQLYDCNDMAVNTIPSWGSSGGANRTNTNIARVFYHVSQ